MADFNHPQPPAACPAPQERRTDASAAVLAMITEIHAQISGLKADIKELDAKIEASEADRELRAKSLVAQAYAAAFPNGDPDGHRRHHELVIKREEAKVKFWNEMVVGAAKWAGLGVLGFLAHAAWTTLLKGPKI